MSKTTGNPTGRPTIFTQELADLICARISKSSLGLHRLHKKYEDFPDPSTIFGWLATNEAFLKQYRIARELQMEYLEEELLEIADDHAFDIETVKGFGGVEYDKENKEVVNRSKLRIHTRMWLMGKIKPKVYGKEAEKIVPPEEGKNELIIKIVKDGAPKKNPKA